VSRIFQEGRNEQPPEIPSPFVYYSQKPQGFDKLSNKNKLPQPTYLLQEGKKRLWFRLPLEEIHFFSLDKDQQLSKIIDFVKTCHAEAELMRIETA
jgi:hypothetical protein